MKIQIDEVTADFVRITTRNGKLAINVMTREKAYTRDGFLTEREVATDTELQLAQAIINQSLNDDEAVNGAPVRECSYCHEPMSGGPRCSYCGVICQDDD